MSEFFFYLTLLPFMLLLFFIEQRDHPVRILQGSAVLKRTHTDGLWNKAKPLPSFRYEFAAATLKDKIYIVGGIFLPSVWFPTRLVEQYDPITDSWKRMRDYPILVHHTGAAACGDSLYVVGGNGIRIMPRADVYAYHPKTDLWEKRADLPVARGALGVTCLNGRIFAVGGGINKRPVALVDEYDPKTNTWTQKSPMPTAREHIAVVSAGGRIFALGGYSGTRFNNLTTNEAYDPKTDTWQTLAPLPYAVSGFAAAAIGNHLFIFGGEQGWAVSSEVHEYDMAKDQWTRRKDMHVGRYALTASTVANSIHVIGGNDVIMGYKFRNDHDIFTP